MKFYGIADAHGIESFNPVTFNMETETLQVDPRELSIMVLRANANRHRHAVVYQAELTKEDARKINDLLSASDYDESPLELDPYDESPSGQDPKKLKPSAKALLKLKASATSIMLARSPGAEKSWNLIPNPDLDPYS
jgi:hypothetical protein